MTLWVSLNDKANGLPKRQPISYEDSESQMIYLITALYQEAKPLIRRLSLKPVSDIHAFPVYMDTDKKYAMIISGPGKASAAAAVGCISTAFKAAEGDFLINIGTAAVLSLDHAKAAGETFICNKITDDASKRTFYPDMLVRTDLDEAQILTVDRVLNSADVPKLGEAVKDPAGLPLLADMEASAVWEAGMRFFAPHRILFVKIVSDDGDGRSVDAKTVERLTDAAAPVLLDLIARAGHMSDQIRAGHGTGGTYADLLGRLEKDLHVSETMRIQLEQLFKYAMLAEIDMKRLIEEYDKAGKLPCKDRREGKKILEQIRNSIL